MREAKIRQAVILAGGKGIRLRPLTLTLPKPMIKIHQKPFLEYLVERLKKNGIEEIIILIGYLGNRIKQHFGDGSKFGLKIKYSYSPVEADTGMRLKKAQDLIRKEFLLLYGDNYWPLDLKKLTEFYREKGTDGLVTVYSNFDHYTKSNMFVDKKGMVRKYDRKRTTKRLNGVDIGFFILKKKVLNLLPRKNCSFEAVVIPWLVKENQLAGFLTHHQYCGLSNLKRIKAIEAYFQPKKIVFLDRDGVINEKAAKGEYITSWSQFKFLPKVIESLQKLKRAGFKIFIVTNQAGVARGKMTESDLRRIHQKMIDRLRESQVEIEKIYACLHGWGENCFCRKPNPGLFFQAASDYKINLHESYFLGDDPRDIIAGKAAGCKTILINQGGLFEAVEKIINQAI